jgi:5-(carboxyamino)imidazole ribonucleotide synthase
MGYDGKGQVRVATRQALAEAWAQLKNVPCVLEKMLPLQAECSVIVARGADGQMVNFPVQLNLHREGILAVTSVYPGAVPADLASQAVQATRAIAEGLNYVGVLCVEFFMLEGGQLVVNEMAPRPHNSGHYTLNACDQSQFDLQVRTLAGLPITQPRQHSSAIMLNLLGDLWPEASAKGPSSPAWGPVLALPGTHLHLYGKLTARPGRKMGHLNMTGDSPEAVRATALQAAALLGIEAFSGPHGLTAQRTSDSAGRTGFAPRPDVRGWVRVKSWLHCRRGSTTPCGAGCQALKTAPTAWPWPPTTRCRCQNPK